MGHLRAIRRLIGLAISTTIAASGWWLSRTLTKRGSRAQVRAHAFWIGGWGKWTFRFIGVRATAEGSPPEAPFVLVSNHLSYLDILALWNFVEGGLFVSKAAVGRWPIFGPLTKLGGTLLIDRTKRTDVGRVREEAKQRISEGFGLVFFPEGTSTPGYEVIRFRPSLFSFALDSNLPVHVASVSYSTPPGSPSAAEHVCWWGDMTFFPHLYNLLKLPRVEARIRFHPEPVHGNERKQLAEACQARCSELFERVEGSQPFDWKGPDTP